MHTHTRTHTHVCCSSPSCAHFGKASLKGHMCCLLSVCVQWEGLSGDRGIWRVDSFTPTPLPFRSQGWRRWELGYWAQASSIPVRRAKALSPETMVAKQQFSSPLASVISRHIAVCVCTEGSGTKVCPSRAVQLSTGDVSLHKSEGGDLVVEVVVSLAKLVQGRNTISTWTDWQQANLKSQLIMVSTFEDRIKFLVLPRWPYVRRGS